MEIGVFLTHFEKALQNEGFTPDAANHHTLKIAKGLTENDRGRISEMKSYDEVVKIASGYSARVKRNASNSKVVSDTRTDTTTISKRFSGAYMEDPAQPKRPASPKSFETEIDEKRFTTSKFTYAPEKSGEALKTGETKKINKVSKYSVPKTVLTPEGRKNYRKMLFKKSPKLCPALFGSFFAVFTVYTLLSLLIVLLICILLAFSALGIVGSLAGFIYGIIKLFSVVSEGLYEIGFALVISGISLAVCIGIYNLTVRAVPELWKNFTDYVKKNIIFRFRTYLNRLKKEANKL